MSRKRELLSVAECDAYIAWRKAVRAWRRTTSIDDRERAEEAMWQAERAMRATVPWYRE